MTAVGSLLRGPRASAPSYQMKKVNTVFCVRISFSIWLISIARKYFAMEIRIICIIVNNFEKFRCDRFELKKPIVNVKNKKKIVYLSQKPAINQW